MIIELLVVVVILSYLYGAGFLDFGSPSAIWISIAIVAAACSVGWFVMHGLVRLITEWLFAFDKWSPQENRKRLIRDDIDAAVSSPEPIQALEHLARNQPASAEVSRRLAQFYLNGGLTDQFVSEKLRIIGAAELPREEVCTIYNRLADIETARGEADNAVAYLRQIIKKYPDTVEARNASRRIEVVCDGASPDTGSA